ncbi:hypothetical protein Hanom_Chr08g00743221 [Helianthus anomalus]
MTVRFCIDYRVKSLLSYSIFFIENCLCESIFMCNWLSESASHIGHVSCSCLILFMFVIMDQSSVPVLFE